jgi:hypothetical protein
LNSSVFSIPDLSLAAGTYYLQFGNGLDTTGFGVYWDVSSGPSSAYGQVDGSAVPLDSGGSETFALYDSTSATPEPSSFLLLGSGLAGLATLIKRKVTA